MAEENVDILKSPLIGVPSTEEVSTQILDTKFGRPEDIIECHIFNLNNIRLQSYPNAKELPGIIFDTDMADFVAPKSDPPGS